MRVTQVRKPATQALPIVVEIDDARRHTDLEVRNHALAAVGETAERFTMIKVQRYADTDNATVTLYRD
jgi:hypothetical protein